MARKRAQATLVDYLVAAIEPALIMIMVGSLMFFLLDSWYTGEFIDRLRWILFWFVFGIVLITRVSMQIGGEQAKGYGVMLGGAVALVCWSFMGIQPVLLVIMGITWWATHKLTLDCTLLDEDQDTGVGLLQQSGLDPSEAAAAAATEEEPPPLPASHHDPDAMDTSLLPDRPWWKLWGSDADGTKRPHAPGVWLIYFTVGSLPLFALAQWFVPAGDADRRAWLFIYFLAYISSGMGLLLATSFLNLRRYLRRRKLKMPAAMTATWLSTGAMLIVGLTAMAAFLPAPISEMRAAHGMSRGSSDHRASKYAVLKDSGVQGEGAASQGEAAEKADGQQPASGKPQGSGENNDPNAAKQTNGNGKDGGAGGQGRGKSGAPKGKPAAGQNGQQGKSGARQDQAGEKAKGGERAGDRAHAEAQAKDKQGRSDEKGGEQGKAEQGDQKGGEPDGKKSSESQQDQGGSSSQAPKPPSLPLPPMDWLQTPIMIAGVIILIYGVIRYGRDWLMALIAIIRSLLEGFGFGGKKERKKDDAKEAAEPSPPPRPFASYSNPFHVGLDHQLTPDDLVIYSFEALEAWAYEHELARSPHETPSEFVARVGQAHPGLGPDATRMVGYFIMIVYGQRGFRDEVLPPLRQFWDALEGSGGAVLAEQSAGV